MPLTDRPQPRCPHCGWLLKFAPYSVVYDNPLNLWEGFCWNPVKEACSFASIISIKGYRVVTAKDAVVPLKEEKTNDRSTGSAQ